MNLAEKLDAIRERGAKRPAEIREAMARAVQALRDAGAADRALKVGDSLPPFSLANRRAVEIRSSELLSKGPLVLTVFRGSW